MYLSSGEIITAAVPQGLAERNARSDARIEQAKCWSRAGRGASYNTLVKPQQTLPISLGTAVNTAKLQGQTTAARAAGLLSTEAAPVIAPAAVPGAHPAPSGPPPTIVPMNPGSCLSNRYQPNPGTINPRPGMPHEAPSIVETPWGPANVRGKNSTVPVQYPIGWVQRGSKPGGLSGWAPPWGNAWAGVPPGTSAEAQGGVWSWVQANPWLALGALGLAGVVAFNYHKRGRR